MKKIILISLVLFLSTTTIFCSGGSNIKSLKSKIVKLNTMVDTKKYENDAEILIINYFNSKKVSLQHVISEMKGELEFRKGLLIKQLDYLARQAMDNKTTMRKAQMFTAKLFDEFVQRVKYVQISEWNNELISAINEKAKQSKTQTRHSYPDIDSSKRHLLSKRS
jgi:hypothetical protein